MTAPDQVSADERVTRVLADHRYQRPVALSDVYCACGDRTRLTGKHAQSYHRAHVAAALTPVLAEMRAEAWDEGYKRRGDAMEAFGKPAPFHLTPPNPYRGGTP